MTAFQKRKEIDADGIFGPITFRAAFAKGAGPSARLGGDPPAAASHPLPVARRPPPSPAEYQSE